MILKKKNKINKNHYHNDYKDIYHLDDNYHIYENDKILNIVKKTHDNVQYYDI